MSTSSHEELRHRGEPLVAYPGGDLWKAVGGSDGVAALVEDLYRRIEQDDVLRVAFPHFSGGAATPFFVQWFGGSRLYSDDLAGGLLRRHQHRYISPKAAAAWLRCMREALGARGLDAEPILRPLARIARAMIHSPETDPRELRRGCDAVQDAAQVRFETLLDDAAKGRTETVRKALAKAPALTSRRGIHNRTLAWVATYRNRPRILKLALKAGDCNRPACDPLHATMACDQVHMGTGVAVTPLAIARKWQPALVADPVPVMELLSASGANINARDETQGTLLMYFARRGNEGAVRWLLAHGSDRNARNKSGKTAAEIARTHAGIVRLLTKS